MPGYAREARLREEFASKRLGPNGEELRRFTVYTVDEDGEPSEEIDLDATGAPAARREAERLLAANYEPGLRITEVTEQFGWYL